MTGTRQVAFETIYRTSWKNILWLLLAGLVLGTFMAHEALTNTQRLLINRIIELSVGQATAFFWVMASIMFGLVLLGLLALLQRLRGSSRLAITSEGLSMPGPAWSPAPRFYPFAAIESLKIVSVYKQRILQAKTQQGRFAIASQNLSSPAEFEKIVALLHQQAPRRVL